MSRISGTHPETAGTQTEQGLHILMLCDMLPAGTNLKPRFWHSFIACKDTSSA